MEGDEGKGVKRKNDGNALLPTTNTNNQEGRKSEDDVQMAGVDVAPPKEVNDDETKTEKLNQIIEKTLDPRFRPKWDELKDAYLKLVLLACKMFTDKPNFERDLRGIVKVIIEDDHKAVAEFVSGLYKECIDNGLIVQRNEFSDRVVPITHGLGQDFLGKFDLDEFHKQILKVLKWHDGEHKDYRSPSFAMVQSSGMGKTKLMQEYKHQCEKDDSCDIECKLILCMDTAQQEPPNFLEHYDAKLTCLRATEKFTENAADDIKHQLGEVERECEKKKVIFFFDEAQKLLPEGSTGSYHTVLWWLRQVRENRTYVGVFAGTLLGLSKFQVVHASSGFSRDSTPTYKNYDQSTEANKLLYDPFYSLTTISVARSHKMQDEFVDDLKDIRKCGCNGRPLFAAMLRRQGSAPAPLLALFDKNIDGVSGSVVITNPTIYNILRRILLSPPSEEPDWTINDDSIASVLGTRVQLGLVNYDFINKATSKGYAMLVRYDTPKPAGPDQMKAFGSVAIVFPPDPVCAALAMGMMQPGWALKKNAGEPQIRGKEPNFWVEDIARLFDQNFCLANRGDMGEVFAALYMLLCGDILRHNEDPCMRVFEVGLKAWLRELKQGTAENPEAPKGADLSTETEEAEVRRSERLKPKDKAEETSSSLTLNFIQVCRNYFRSHAWLGQSMLEYMYDTATGCYVFPLCPAIDIVFPVKRVNTKGEIAYHPCLVSVKCWDSIQLAEMKGALDSMRNYLKNHRTKDDQSSALCLLLVIGASSSPKDLPQRQGTFPNEDAYISIVVPSKDKFGVNEAIKNMACASHISELLASHSFAYGEKNESALRVTATETYHELGRSLLNDKQQLLKAQNPPN